MKKKIIYAPYMLRPLIYMTAFRLMVALIFLLVMVRLVPGGPRASLVCGFLAVLFALFAYLVYLRMDGLRIPRVKFIRPRKKPDPLRSPGGITDHIDDDAPLSFDELEDDEKDFCSLASSLLNLALFLAASFLL